MKLLLLVIMFAMVPYNVAVSQGIQPPKTKSPQEIIDDVNNSIDNVDCGINDIAQSAVSVVNDEIIDEINTVIQDVLDSYDLGCIDALLDSGFLGIFNISFELPSFCEVVNDAISKNVDSPLFKTSKGKEFKNFIEKSIEDKNNVKERITDY